MVKPFYAEVLSFAVGIRAAGGGAGAVLKNHN